MRILVTGGAGFIGSHLCERLLEQDHDVVCFDDFSTGSLHNIPQSSVKFMTVGRDLVDYSLDYFSCMDQIYNLASPASPVQYQKNPIHTMKTNVIGSINVLELAKRTGARILQASTSEVYGDPLEHPQREEYWGNVNPIGPRACYDEGKRAAECLFMDYHRQYDVDIRIARIFNTYGPRMQIDDGRVVSNFIVQALKGKPLVIYGNGLQTRSFCYVDDMVGGLIKLMNSHTHCPVNFGSTEEITILELAEKILGICNSSQGVRFLRCLPEDDPKRRNPDTGRASDLLLWKPRISLDYGLRKTIDYFTSLLR